MFNPTFLLIATGHYNQYVDQCKESIKKYFPDSLIYLFGDSDEADYKIEHQAWPYVTLYRFHYFNKVKPLIMGDYCYFMDIDAKFVDKPEIQGDLVGVRHCAFYYDFREVPQETNKQSIFFNYKFKFYFGGGFFGGKKEEFFKLSRWCQEGIDKDQANRITPRHNDETALNGYFSIHEPTLQLDPSYHYPKSMEAYFSKRCWGNKMPFKPVIELIDKFQKDGEEKYRSET